METLLISLHPRHAQNILSGKKIIELRKKGVREDRYGTTFDYILIYETLPTAAIIGVCEAGEILYKDAQTFSNNYQ